MPTDPDGLGKPESHLVGAILATLCCCLPFGIVAIVFAAQVDSKWNAGDQQGAASSSESALTWIKVSVICGLIGGALSVIIRLANHR